MPKKTIIVTACTLHVSDESKSTPFKFDREGRPISGFLHVDQVPPGQPATLDATEADKILRQFGGSEVNPETGEIIRTVDRVVPGSTSYTNQVASQ